VIEVENRGRHFPRPSAEFRYKQDQDEVSDEDHSSYLGNASEI
jgi:hypothetical protein